VGQPPEPPPDEQPPPTPPIGAEGGECPRCSTPYEPFQEYCLECGLRLPVSSGIIPVLSTAWRRRVPWYPGDWIWPVLGALIVAALAAAIAILATTDNGSPTRTTAATGPPVPGGTGTIPTEPPPGTNTSSLPTPTIPTTTGATTEELPPPPPPPPPPSTELIEWPQGQNGWTIVLASIPESSGRGGATRVGRDALAAGLTDVGVLNSSEFSSLHPGYFVVFSGIYSSESEARGAIDAATSSYPQAYARQITQ
jgi:hypothetical protein